MTFEPIDKLSDRTGEEEDSQTLVDVWNRVAKLIDVVNLLQQKVVNLENNVDQQDPIKHIPAPRTSVEDNGHWTTDIETGHLVEDVDGNWRIYLASNPPAPTEEQVKEVIADWEKWSDGRKWGRSLAESITKYMEYRNWQEKTKLTQPALDETIKQGGSGICGTCHRLLTTTSMQCPVCHFPYGKPATAHLTEQESVSTPED